MAAIMTSNTMGNLLGWILTNQMEQFASVGNNNAKENTPEKKSMQLAHNALVIRHTTLSTFLPTTPTYEALQGVCWRQVRHGTTK